MDRTPTRVPSPTSIRKAPAFMSVAELMVLIGAKALPPLIDVREPAQFHPRHIAGSQNCPDSQTTALVKKLQAVEKAVLVCNDGKVSALVARTLGFCKINNASYLEGGMAAWAAAGGKLAETTRSGFEHELPPPPPPGPPPDPAPTRWLKSIKNTLFGSEEDAATK